MQKLITFLATGFYLGKAPKAPGTFGTLGAIPIWCAMMFLPPVGYVIVTLALILVAIVVSDIYGKDFEEHDRQEIVIDEIVGFLVTMTFLPMSWKSVVIGFVLFRALDILKPWPISYFDKHIKGGMGVVVDDVAAGLIANIILQVLLQLRVTF